MNFAEAMKQEQKWTRTENGAVALNTTSDALLDLFGTIGALRNADETRITTLFEEAYKADPLIATKILFYARDIRGDEETSGLGERKVFRVILKYCAKYHPEAIRPNLDLIGVYGRYDDLYELVGTPLEDEMWTAMKKQFEEDLDNMAKGNAISLLAKWIKTADASSDKTRALGKLTAQKLGYDVYNFKRIMRAMRKQIGIVEALMSTGRWDEIKYPEVPSRAMMIYRNAFKKHDEERFNQFAQKAVTGEVKINSSTLYPYDIVRKYSSRSWYNGKWYDGSNLNKTEENVLQAQWDQLPNYVNEGTNALVIADTSGSMNGRPMDTAVSLAIYFAQRNHGAFKNLWMNFSSNPSYQEIKGKTLKQILNNINYHNWSGSTNCKAAFEMILDTAIQYHIPQEDMPKALIIISDMEFDYCGGKNWTFYDQMKNEFARNGYEIPSIIFWNVESRHDVFHTDKNRKGTILCSGQSASIFKQLMSSVNYTPMEFMMKTVNAKRYDPITVG